jgi:integrase
VQCVSFCQHLEDTGSSKRACINHMDALRGMLSAAVDKKIIPTNPAARVKPDGTIKVKDREPFTGAELQLILGMAAATRFGDDRHEAVMWALRLLVWTGARPREIFQLRKVDVRREAGIPMIDICEGHPLQSVKSGFARWVPLAPAVEGFLEYAASQPNEFVFGEFTHNPQKGRSHWLVNAFIEFRRKHITRDPLKTLYSIRHRFHDVLDNALVPEAQQFALVGHASAAVHRKYKKRPAMRLLYAAMCRLEPFED